MTLISKTCLAILYKKQGKYQRAQQLLREALQASMSKLKSEHRITLWGKEALAGVYQDQGAYDRAEPLLRELTDVVKHKYGVDTPAYGSQLARLGHNLLCQKRYANAEPLLRDCLKIRAAKQPDDWATFNTQALLGGALLGQKKYADAEPLLLSGYKGMKQREGKIPPQGVVRLTEALERLVQLYEAAGKKDEAAKWQQELDKAKQATEKEASKK